MGCIRISKKVREKRRPGARDGISCFHQLASGVRQVTVYSHVAKRALFAIKDPRLEYVGVLTVI